MTSKEIVTRAIEFGGPPRLPFWQHGIPGVPDDIIESAELDRSRSGWFFGESCLDDWGCGWSVDKDAKPGDMGQVVHHPLQDWEDLRRYRPPNPRDSYYFERIEPSLAAAGDRYVLLTSHFNLLERLHMLHGFSQTLEAFYLEPEKVDQVLDMVLEFKLGLFAELHRRMGDRVDGLFLTDDWASQENTFVGPEVFERFFLKRYARLVDAVHEYGWHFILHTDGRVNGFVPFFISLGVDMLNLLQPRTVGITEIGEAFAGDVAFLTLPDIQQTLPSNDPVRIRDEVRELVGSWSTRDGGLVVAACGDGQLLGMDPGMPEAMYRAFMEFGV